MDNLCSCHEAFLTYYLATGASRRSEATQKTERFTKETGHPKGPRFLSSMPDTSIYTFMNLELEKPPAAYICWLIFMQALYPGRKTLQEMVR